MNELNLIGRVTRLMRTAGTGRVQTPASHWPTQGFIYDFFSFYSTLGHDRVLAIVYCVHCGRVDIHLPKLGRVSLCFVSVWKDFIPTTGPADLIGPT